VRDYQDTEEFDLHRRLVGELESNVNNRNWWVWIHFHVDDDGEFGLAGLADEVETWLGSLDPDIEIESGYGLEWTEGPLHVELKAIPRRRERRGAPPLVGNPFPPVAFWS
jgi:hypothetical protein